MTYHHAILILELGLSVWQAMECESGRLVSCPMTRRDVIAARVDGA